jgi:Gly-Xaa carboxypeptidase
MVIDEGTGTVDDVRMSNGMVLTVSQYYGAPFAVPGTSEKGYLDIVISVGTDGGVS